MKKIFSSLIIVAALFSSTLAAEMSEQEKKDHVYDCIKQLSVFSVPENAPENHMILDYQNDSLIFHFDSAHVTKMDQVLDEWKDKCQDLFDSKVYSPHFFKDSPLLTIVEKIAKEQRKEKMEAIGNDSLTKEQARLDSIKGQYTFTFQYGVLQSILIKPRLGKRYQYKYNGTNLLWGENGVIHEISMKKTPLGFADDSLKVYSGYYEKDYDKKTDEYGRVKLDEKYVPWKKVLTKSEYPSLDKNALNGEFSYDPKAYSPIPSGTATKNWALKFAGTVGIHVAYFTDDILDDHDADRDSSAHFGESLGGGFNADVTIGAIHCSPTSERCFGFGAGYGGAVWVLNKVERDLWGDSVATESNAYINGVKVYGEYYFKHDVPVGIREALTVPLNTDMKYLESRTAVFAEPFGYKIEFGFVVSPIQYIPGVYLGLGACFRTPSF